MKQDKKPNYVQRGTFLHIVHPQHAQPLPPPRSTYSGRPLADQGDDGVPALFDSSPHTVSDVATQHSQTVHPKETIEWPCFIPCPVKIRNEPVHVGNPVSRLWMAS